MDKRILVHFKYYPDVASVPDRIPHSKMGQVGRVFLYRYLFGAVLRIHDILEWNRIRICGIADPGPL
jgi:hypothetical protein